ncbi:P-loop containing nucleoside triphosphate hydrolase protein [Serendipita vermifera]|nr:P-loop containing nucleoside triphosphate hydrolase protein [Serendipita vermifera]
MSQMRLRTLIPTLPFRFEHEIELIEALSILGIVNAQDFLLHYLTSDLFQRLPEGVVEKILLKKLYEYISSVLMSDATRGDVQYARERSLATKLGDPPNTGITQVDLKVRLPHCGIVEVAGLSGTGKTFLVMNIIIKYLLQYESALAMWFDPLGNFSPERGSGIAHRLVETFPEGYADPLTRLQVSAATDLAATYDVLEKMEAQLKETGYGVERVKLVVFDPVTPLLGPNLSATSSKGHALMASFMRHLSSLAKQYGLLIFLINTATRVRVPPPEAGEPVPKPAYKPSLGPSFSHMTDMSLFMSSIGSNDRSGRSTRFALRVLKSRESNAGIRCYFGIRNDAIIE